ncbi:hypothetical protein Csa_006276 [Cucumis sativus]|uniref:Uncharacterized protein n=1 Tax=Cucumis sativus TaxID=3659 RepID=A0A0A0LLZ7_CUCSA|nr:hypothetical protein Csa_006276 [Cucumis sativus]
MRKKQKKGNESLTLEEALKAQRIRKNGDSKVTELKMKKNTIERLGHPLTSGR